MVLKRATVATCNILFPPIAVWMLCGAGEDLLINSVLFLLAVIPSHIHGFYLSWTYFNRKRKIRRGEYPGGWRPMIYSSKVQNGGASSKDIRQFKNDRDMEKREKARKKKQEGGRIRRLFRRIIHRKDPLHDDGFSYDTEKEYVEPITPSYESSTIHRPLSRRQSDQVRASRHSSRRNSYTSPEVNDAPRAREPGRRSHPPRAILQSALLKRTGTNNTSHSRHNSVHSEGSIHNNVVPLSRRNSSRRPLSNNDEALADYVARPTLPQRPGTSYRDDIDNWRRSVTADGN